jgi:hypothetical protein
MKTGTSHRTMPAGNAQAPTELARVTDIPIAVADQAPKARTSAIPLQNCSGESGGPDRTVRMLARRLRRAASDSLWAGLPWTPMDESPATAVRFELENDAGGHRWTFYQRHGIQKVRGSNPLGSTIVMSQVEADRCLT